MAVTKFNLQQKALANKPYIETYGIDLLNKIAQFKFKVNFENIPQTKLSNLKRKLKVHILKILF